MHEVLTPIYKKIVPFIDHAIGRAILASRAGLLPLLIGITDYIRQNLKFFNNLQGRETVSHLAHIQEVVGSTPTPARFNPYRFAVRTQTATPPEDSLYGRGGKIYLDHNGYITNSFFITSVRIVGAKGFCKLALLNRWPISVAKR